MAGTERGKNVRAANTGRRVRALSGGSSALPRAMVWGLLLALLVPGFLSLLFLHALPVAMFETVVSFFDTVEDLADTFGFERQSGVGFFSALKNFFHGVADAAGDLLWTGFRSLFTAADEEHDGAQKRVVSAIDRDALSANGEEMMIAQEEDPEKATLRKNIRQTKEAVQERCRELRENILRGSSREELARVLEKQFEASFGAMRWDPQTAASSPERARQEYYTFEAPSVTVTTPTLSDREAVEILSLYTVMRHTSLQDMRLSDYQKWLGYRPSYLFPFLEHLSRNQVEIDLGLGADNPKIPRWIGTCMPQYLADQEKFEQDHFGKDLPPLAAERSCAFLDLYLTLHVPDPAGVSPTITPDTQTVRVQVPVPPRPEEDTAWWSAWGEAYTAWREAQGENPGADGEVTRLESGGASSAPDSFETEIAVTVYRVQYHCPITVGKRDMKEEMMAILGLTGTQEAFENGYDAGRAAGSGAAGDGFLWPVTSHTITSPFGMRVDPVSGAFTRLHAGVDIAEPAGRPVRATLDGTVTLAGWNGGYGNCVIVHHENGYDSVYGHMSRLAVRGGDRVSRGEILGYVGSTGNSTGPHLHFELRENSAGSGAAVDPMRFAYLDYGDLQTGRRPGAGSVPGAGSFPESAPASPGGTQDPSGNSSGNPGVPPDPAGLEELEMAEEEWWNEAPSPGPEDGASSGEAGGGDLP